MVSASLTLNPYGDLSPEGYHGAAVANGLLATVSYGKVQQMIVHSLIKCNEWHAPLGRLTTLSLVSAEVQQPRPDTKSGRSLSLGLLLGKAKYKKDTLDCSSRRLTRLSLLITGSGQLSPSQMLSQRSGRLLRR